MSPITVGDKRILCNPEKKKKRTKNMAVHASLNKKKNQGMVLKKIKRVHVSN
jgi:hypothetical protein